MALFYAALFAGPGISLPFLPVFLAARGLDPGFLGATLGASQAARLVSAPLGGRLADAIGDRRAVAVGAAGLGAIALLLMLPEAGPVLLVTAVVLAALAAGPLLPIGDAAALRVAAVGGGDFGRMRAAGSLSFMLATGLGGMALGATGPWLLPWLVLALQAGVVGAAALLPDAGVGPARGRGGAADLLRKPGFVLLLLVSGLTQGSHALYYGFSALHWGRAGLSPGLVGALWVLGILAEILLLTFGRGAMARLGPVRLLAAGAGGAALRWTGTALTAEPLPLAMLQPLHAVSFAMTMVGAAQLIARMVPPERGATAQALHSALGPGLATAVLNPLSGVLYERFGGGSFLAMAAVAAASWPGIAALGRMTAGQPAMSDPETRL
ncbi:MFS transporter [Elioraea sp.]|uniref:MFS transporter n=1 Tax=Elioraea sp. TaxID=2185103 RepID=UPI0021DE6B93|nr:MFS transporter [Elioraea sp.]GIX09510.1 MAG: MFS transporter [Elioraea sp.]